ncbi:SAM-dependent methyltransferase [Streptomyces canus]|uniref:SAM-dependent methyltransferase n=1 Tax=Streptomyces canus TaxID=58343 RepID=UPI0027D7FE24|nr:SAM-dependent methyltransferase [Streptomyces canus]
MGRARTGREGGHPPVPRHRHRHPYRSGWGCCPSGRADPGARVGHVDNDPLVLVLAHARALSTPEGATDCLQADLRARCRHERDEPPRS